MIDDALERAARAESGLVRIDRIYAELAALRTSHARMAEAILWIAALDPSRASIEGAIAIAHNALANGGSQ